MKHSMVPVLLMGMAFAACGGTTQSDPTDQSPSASAPLPAAADSKPRTVSRAMRLQPQAARTLLSRTSTIVEGTVTAIGNSYDERSGPRTIYTFEVATVVAGATQPDVLELNVYGGLTPDGKGASTSKTVFLSQGARYIVFLSNEAWFYSPWIGVPLRLEEAAGQTVLVGPEGHVVVGFEPGGIRYGEPFEHSASKAAPLPGASAALTSDEFVDLVNEAMEVESIRPAGSFFDAPVDRGSDWRVRPTVQ